MKDHSKQILFHGKFKRFISVAGWEFTERVGCGGVVAVIPIIDHPVPKLVFVEQYRVPVRRNVIELPAGLANDTEAFAEETLEDAARRELFEETGYQAGKMEYLAQGPASAASLTDIIHLFLATELKKTGAGGGDETENIKVHEIYVSDVDDWLRQKEREGFWVDPKVYAGLYLLNRRGTEKTKGDKSCQKS